VPFFHSLSIPFYKGQIQYTLQRIKNYNSQSIPFYKGKKYKCCVLYFGTNKNFFLKGSTKFLGSGAGLKFWVSQVSGNNNFFFFGPKVLRNKSNNSQQSILQTIKFNTLRTHIFKQHVTLVKYQWYGSRGQVLFLNNLASQHSVSHLSLREETLSNRQCTFQFMKRGNSPIDGGTYTYFW
jgi:hypothetical protein